MYRDVLLSCPQCGVPLVSLDAREKWRCKQCVGVLVGVAQLELELGETGRLRIFVSPERPRAGTRPCPRCRNPMDVIRLAGMDVERCVSDGVAWFDRGELGRACRELTDDTDRAASAFLAQLVRDAGG